MEFDLTGDVRRSGSCLFDEDSMECPSTNTTPVKASGGGYQIPVTPPPSTSKGASAGASNGKNGNPAVLLVNNEEDLTTPDKSQQATPPFARHPPPVPQKKAKKHQHLPRKSSNAIGSDGGPAPLKAKKRLDFNQPVSFSLPKLHEHLFGSLPKISHGAEADCMALLRVCALKYDKLEPWIESNARPFTEVKKLW